MGPAVPAAREAVPALPFKWVPGRGRLPGPVQTSWCPSQLSARRKRAATRNAAGLAGPAGRTGRQVQARGPSSWDPPGMRVAVGAPAGAAVPGVVGALLPALCAALPFLCLRSVTFISEILGCCRFTFRVTHVDGTSWACGHRVPEPWGHVDTLASLPWECKPPSAALGLALGRQTGVRGRGGRGFSLICAENVRHSGRRQGPALTFPRPTSRSPAARGVRVPSARWRGPAPHCPHPSLQTRGR